ncbi:hypothetical protein [Streptomyces sp. C10-9-1]|uniref:hypothetical protein n=1 Tax=Streptomyces sp. C10-9-1 TaxID=1859285 RepID=UPI003F4A07A6
MPTNQQNIDALLDAYADRGRALARVTALLDEADRCGPASGSLVSVAAIRHALNGTTREEPRR